MIKKREIVNHNSTLTNAIPLPLSKSGSRCCWRPEATLIFRKQKNLPHHDQVWALGNMEKGHDALVSDKLSGSCVLQSAALEFISLRTSQGKVTNVLF